MSETMETFVARFGGRYRETAFDKVELGMPDDQVKAILGQPATEGGAGTTIQTYPLNSPEFEGAYVMITNPGKVDTIRIMGVKKRDGEFAGHDLLFTEDGSGWTMTVLLGADISAELAPEADGTLEEFANSTRKAYEDSALARLQPWLSREEVVALLGPPDEVSGHQRDIYCYPVSLRGLGETTALLSFGGKGLSAVEFGVLKDADEFAQRKVNFQIVADNSPDEIGSPSSGPSHFVWRLSLPIKLPDKDE